MNLKYSIGLDTSSKKINGCVSLIYEIQMVTVKSSIVFSNNIVGFKIMEYWILKNHQDKQTPLVVCMEATEVYHENCALYLFEKQYKTSIILPNKAKHYLIS